MAVVVIVLLLTAYFQSIRLALVAVLAIPAVLAGVVAILLATGTTLNIQSFMGAIMAIGVAVANAILLVTFAERDRRRKDWPRRSGGRGGANPAAADPHDQLRHDRRHDPDGAGPGQGGEQTAPLAGRSSAAWPRPRRPRCSSCPPSSHSSWAAAARFGVARSLRPGQPASRTGGSPCAITHAFWPRHSRLAFAGCNKRPAAPTAQAAAATAPKIAVITPELRSMHRTVEQPGTIHAFEETAIFARLTGFVGSIDEDPEKKNHPPHDRQIDRGSRVRKGQVLAELAIPELDQEFRQKEALVKQAESEVIQAEKGQAAAGAAVAVATESVREAEAGVIRAQALLVRWHSEAERIGGLVKGGLIDSQTRDETQNQLKAAEAARNESIARVAAMRAEVKKAEANRDKAAADSDAARARLEVARANVGEVNARRTYLKIAAPYDGIVTRRSVNTGDLVSAAEKTPLFVVARIDPVRVVVRVAGVRLGVRDAWARGTHRLPERLWPGHDRSGIAHCVVAGTRLTDALDRDRLAQSEGDHPTRHVRGRPPRHGFSQDLDCARRGDRQTGR